MQGKHAKLLVVLVDDKAGVKVFKNTWIKSSLYIIHNQKTNFALIVCS